MQTLMNKKTIGVVLIVIMAAFLYNFFSPSISSSDFIGPDQAVGADLLKISEELSRVTLNNSLFSKSEYLRLSDFSTSVPPQPIGRRNPFDVIGRD